MENRSHALIAGLFTILLAAATALVIVWLNRDNRDLVPYDLVTVGSVRGLTPQADVRYRGLLVGKVQSIGFEPDGQGVMLIRIGVQDGTPMTDALKATIEMKGVTGVAYVDLNDDGRLGQPLPSSASKVARMDMQPGLTERLMDQAGELMDRLQTAGDQVVAMLGPENQRALHTALENVADATAQMDSLLANLQPAVAEAVPMMRSFKQAAGEANTAVREIAGLATDARRSLATITGPGGMVEQAGQSVADLRRAAAQLAGVVPQVSGAVGEVGQAARSASRTLQQVERAPQSLLFGPAPVRPGPGEPGFEGFQGQ
ncbi:MCE family protein [Achromobacter sp. GG226]|uniref:MlaD family protein n=1 Tax=Verticiella alkaliphila TaxID=2779529 RepID=UPI001C0D97E0|nr:MlaD family protein [Verticiella sp. GG226]MBU4610719.1 MCE family protein [Verticiella sp. GG226]